MQTVPDASAPAADREIARPWPAPGWARAATALAALALWVGLLDFPKATPPTDLDFSWSLALGHFLKNRRQAGADYFFSYGPLGYLVTPVYDPDLFGLKFGWEVAVNALYVLTILRLTRGYTSPWARAGVLAGVALLAHQLVTLPDVLCLFVMLAQATSLLETGARRPAWSVLPRTLLMAALALVKFTLLTYAACAVGVVFLDLWRRGARRQAAECLIGFVGALLLVWCALGQNPAHLPAYFRGSLEVAAGYTESMALPGPALELGLAGAAVVGLAAAWAVGMARRDPQQVGRGLLVGLAVFLMWKNGFVRHDHHSFGFFALTLLLAVATPSLLHRSGEWSRVRPALAGAVGLLSVIGMQAALAKDLLPFRHDPLGLLKQAAAHGRRALSVVANPAAARARLGREAEALARSYELPQTRSEVGSATVDLISYEQGLLLVNQLNWTPRPAFQSYFACTPWLLARNARFLEPPHGPDYVVFKLEPIDGRLPALEDSAALFPVFRHYQPVLVEKGYLLLKRQSGRPAPADAGSVGPPRRVVHVGEEVPLEESGAPQKVHLEMQLTGRGRLAKQLYKLPPLFISVRTADGRAHRFRFIPHMARDGFLLSPLLATNYDVLQLYGRMPGRRVVAFRLEGEPGWDRFYKSRVLMTRESLPELVRHPLRADELDRIRYPAFATRPEEASSATAIAVEQVGGSNVLMVHAPGEMTFAVPPGAHRLSGSFGVLPPAYEVGTTDGVLFRVETGTEGTVPVVLYERHLDPVRNPGDRGVQTLSVDLPRDAGALRLRTLNLPGHTCEWDWSYWSGVRID
jgi:hypothetical protein